MRISCNPENAKYARVGKIVFVLCLGLVVAEIIKVVRG